MGVAREAFSRDKLGGMTSNLEATLRDPARLRALVETGLLDSAPEVAFDRLTRLASKILRVPVALVSLVDDHRQFFKSAVGLGEPWATRRETPLSHSFCQHAVASREPLVVFDAREHPLLRHNLAIVDLDVVAYAGVPLVTSDAQALGALCVIEATPRRWTDEEMEVLRELAASVVTEIELRRVARESLAAAEALAVLQAAAEAANMAESSAEVTQRCLDLLCAHTTWPVGHAYLKRGDALVSGELWSAGTSDRFEDFRALTARTRLESGVGLPGRVLASGEPESVDDAGADPGSARAATARAVGLRGGFALPVRVGSEVVAVLEFYADTAESLDARTRAVMANVGTQLGRVVERERHAAAVEGLSLTDELTGLHNRRGFTALAAQALALATRQGKSAQLCFIDMDGLKRINDEFGHEAGDRALVELATVLKKTFRQSDVVARLGGDEFVVFAPEASEQTRPSIRSRLNAQLATHNVKGEREFTLSASVGLTTYDPSNPQTLDALLARADALMYEDKRSRKAGR